LARILADQKLAIYSDLCSSVHIRGSIISGVENYFNYFTEIEEHFQKRRGTLIILSPLDWALMEIWKDAGIPLEAVLRGIDTSFDKWERRPRRTRKVNSLAYSAQEVLAAAEEMKDAAVGAAPAKSSTAGLEHSAVAAFLRQNADALATGALPGAAQIVADEASQTLRGLAHAVEQGNAQPMEDLERRLTVSEEKLIAALLASTPDDALFALRSEADRDLAPYRSKMTAPQIEQLHKQYVQKRLLEKYKVPRLSLFYM
jgi:hypothetical protein